MHFSEIVAAAAAGVISMSLVAGMAQGAEIVVYSTISAKEALIELVPEFERASSHKVTGLGIAQPYAPGPAADALERRGPGPFQALYRTTSMSAAARWVEEPTAYHRWHAACEATVSTQCWQLPASPVGRTSVSSGRSKTRTFQ